MSSLSSSLRLCALVVWLFQCAAPYWMVVLLLVSGCAEGSFVQPQHQQPVGRLGALLGRRRGRNQKSNSPHNSIHTVDSKTTDPPRNRRRRQRRPQPIASTPPLAAVTTEVTPIAIAPDCTIHVASIRSDDPWWTADTNDADDDHASTNPYGARVWPASVGIARVLWEKLQERRGTATLHSTGNHLHRHHQPLLHVLELGCGTGLVAQTAAVAGASRVQATDISPVALALTQQGWKCTTTNIQQQQEQGGGPYQEISPTVLRTQIYDICTPLLPTPTMHLATEQLPPPPLTSLLIASCVLYEGPLGVAMAQRVREAYDRGMWILLGDDDTGYRDGGRDAFLQQLGSFPQCHHAEWQHGIVQCPELGWREKPFSYLELNRPEDDDDNG